MARVHAVLFDIDGTLLDSNDAQAHAWLDSLRGHGRSVAFERVRSKIGMGAARLLFDLTGIEHTSVEGHSIAERRTAILKSYYLPDVGPFHGARMLVDRLRSRGLVCAALSPSASAGAVLDLLRAAGVADLIDVVVSSDDADPEENLVRSALERIGVPPQEAILVGDTPFDIEAGRRAGVGVVALRCGGGFSDHELAGAIAIYDDPAALSARLDNSPFAFDYTTPVPSSPSSSSRESEPPSSPHRDHVGTRRVAV
jgi:phosphoglycolate phosphatase-like HAD superfamily hydrolase